MIKLFPPIIVAWVIMVKSRSRLLLTWANAQSSDLR